MSSHYETCKICDSFCCDGHADEEWKAYHVPLRFFAKKKSLPRMSRYESHLAEIRAREELGYPGHAWKVWLPDYEVEPEGKNWCAADPVALAAELFALEYFGKHSKGAVLYHCTLHINVREKDGTLHQFVALVDFRPHAQVCVKL